MIKFKDKNIQESFDRNGFVSFPLLPLSTVEELRKFYFEKKKFHLTDQEILHSTSDTGDYELIKEVDAKLKAIMLPALDKVIYDYEPFLGNFLTKEPGDKSATGFHQDPTLVDENLSISGNVWLALQDTHHDNGNLRAIRGSHKWAQTLRVTPNFPNIFENFKDELISYSTEIPVKAGHAIFISHGTIHGATENLTDEERIAAVLAIKSNGSPWYFYYLEPGNSYDKIEKYLFDTEAFARLKKNQRPTHGKFLGYISYDYKPISKKEFKELMHKNFNTESVLNRLKRMMAK